MRILASNPDTLGDLILRQPLYAALQEAGHELMLLVRPGVRPAVRYVAPGAAVVELPYEPYAADVVERWDRFEPAIRAAIDFEPELLLVAPYRWTLFDEKLAASMPAGVRTAGMSGHLFPGDPRAGLAPTSTLRFDIPADVRGDDAEIDKNAKLAAALGCPVVSADPHIAPAEDAQMQAAVTLARLGFDDRYDFRTICVTGTAHVSLKTWQAERWAAFLSQWIARHPDERLLFTGLREERPDAEAVRALLPVDMARRSAIWDGALDELVALIARSSGYIGHDTGPMHLAAALGKPVLGVFGGGTWPRFVPAVSPSVAVMVHVPCVGCGWSCSFETSHCIKDVPIDAIMQAADDLDAGRVTGRERRELEPTRDLLAQMTREAAGIVQREIRLAAQVTRDLASAHRARQAESDEAERARGEVLAVREEARQLREGRDAFEAEMRRLAAQEDALRAEAKQLQAEQEARAAEIASLTITLDARKQAIQHLAAEVSHFAEQDTLPPREANAAEPEETEELTQLRQAIDRLKQRIPARRAAALQRPPRRPLRQVLIDLAIGQKHYAGRAPLALPRITIVTPSLNDSARLRRTIESVAAQDYQDLEYIIVDGGSTDDTPAVLEAFKGRIDRLVRGPDDGPMAAVAKGFDLARGDVVHFLIAGDVLEPGGVLRVAEWFGRHRGANVAYFDDAVETPDGWRFVPPREPTADVYTLLGLRERFRNGVWLRRDAYERIGKLRPELGRAADWELWLRLDRRWELRRVAGQVRRVQQRRGGASDAAYREDLARARAAFLPTFGRPGRVRCGLVHVVNRIWDALAGALRADRLHYGYDGASPLPSVEPPAFVAGQPICPLSNRHPDRLLYSTPDVSGGDRALNVVYYDSTAGAAVTYPPVTIERLSDLYERHARNSQRPVVPGAAGVTSPFAGYIGSRLARLLSRVPSPYWWFAAPRFEDTTADDLLAALSDLKSQADSDVRLLVVGCYEGALLDALKARTKWCVAGTDTNERAIAVARHKGHTVWEASPMDAASRIPTGESFDVLFLNGVAAHLQDPLLVLRRLRQLLRPGGLVVINQPNLDSAQLALYGPTWFHWRAPYHRVLMGRRAVKRLAHLTDLKLIRFRTTTLPYTATASAQLNALGLGAVVPEGAKFPNEISSRGVRLTGWSRLLWDWRGKGDVMYAVMKAV